MNTKIKPNQIFNGLDAMRGWAAISVVLFHSSQLLNAQWLMPSGHLAVDLFFVLSGFVIAHSYDRRMPFLGAVGFVRIRLIRLYPLYALGLILGCVRIVGLLTVGQSLPGALSAIAAAFVFLPAPVSIFSAGSIAPINGPSWSLLFEFWINVWYAIFSRWLITSVLVIVVVASGSALVLMMYPSGALAGTKWVGLEMGVARVGFSFPMGILLYRLRKNLPDMQRLTGLLPMGLFVSFMTLSGVVHDLLFVIFLSPLFVLIGSYAIKESISARYGATSSYCLYAIHAPILMVSGGLANRLGFPTVPFILVVLAVLFAICPLIHKFFDVIIRRRINLFLLSRAPLA